ETELTSNAVLAWSEETSIARRYIAPGRPIPNPFVGSFKGLLRDKRLNAHLFDGLHDACRMIVASRIDCKAVPLYNPGQADPQRVCNLVQNSLSHEQNELKSEDSSGGTVIRGATLNAILLRDTRPL
ncbi:MAG: integrase core domain-containing protein, partial [Pseudomonadota bacterium]